MKFNKVTGENRVSVYSMDDKEVLIKEPLFDIPEFGSEDFELELVNVARAVHLAKTKARFDSLDSESWADLTCKHEGKFVSKYLRELFQANEKYRIAYNINDAGSLAELVHSDYPAQLVLDLFRALKTEGAKIDKSLFVTKPFKVFTKGVVAIEALLPLMIRKISPTAFAHKWHFERIRPEEAIALWAKGEYKVSKLADEVLRQYVNVEEVLKDPRTFTMYPEGCPPHPSLPAMHSAVAAMALLMKVLFNLTDEQETEVTKYAANIAFGRTFAGVHFRLDNIYGLELGERCAAIILPQIAEDLMDAVPEKIEMKVKEKMTNWLV